MTLILSLLFSFCFAFELPSGLQSDEQRRVLDAVGLGATSKFLSNAYPLGGYSGFETSLTLEAIDTKDIATFGNTTRQTSTVYLPSITIGKGIFNNSDIFIHFVPPRKNQDITRYGASFRWGFYQALFLPLNFSAVFHTGLINIGNDVSATNLGADIIMGMHLAQFNFVLGGGWANSSGRFTGGTNGVTASLNTETQKVESSHFMFGATYNFEPFFMGFAIDRYQDVVYSLKSGFLF